jgi:hypothetical protein
MTRGRWMLIGLLGCLVAVGVAFQLLVRPALVTPMNVNGTTEVGRGDAECSSLTISRYGLPGESRLHWTIKSNGELTYESVAPSGASSVKVGSLEPHNLLKVQEIMDTLPFLAGTYTGATITHDNLALVVTCDGGVAYEVLLRRGARPKEVIGPLTTLDSLLGEDFAIGY